MSEIQKGRIEFNDPTFRERLDYVRQTGDISWLSPVELVSIKVGNLEAELDTLKSFVRSLNSYSFEKWIGCYHEGQFCIFDGEGEVVAVGKDAYQAWKMFVENENK